MVPARPPPHRRRRRPDRARRPPLVPLPPHLERVRVPAPAPRRRRARRREAGGGLLPHADRPALGRSGFWYGRRLVARLRAAHTAAGLLTVAAAVAGAAARHDRGGDSTPLAVLGWCVEGALLVGGCTAAAVVCRRGRSERRLDQRLDGTLITWLPGSAAVLLVLAAGYASWSRPDWASAGSPAGDATFGVVALAQGCLVLALAAVAVRACTAAPPAPRTALHGLAGPAVAMLACALGGLMAGGVAQRVADWLAAPADPGPRRGEPWPGRPSC